MEIEQPGTELLPLSRRVPGGGVPSAQPRRRRGLHRHEDLPVPAPHPAALHAQRDPPMSSFQKKPENLEPHADLDGALGRTCCAHRPAPALAGTSKRSCSEEYRRRPPPPPFIVGAGERGERGGDAVWRGEYEGRRPRGTTGGGGRSGS